MLVIDDAISVLIVNAIFIRTDSCTGLGWLKLKDLLSTYLGELRK